MWAGWLVIAGLCFVIEIYTVGFFIFWFGIGALITLISSFFIKNIVYQAVIFIISSSLLLLLTKPLSKKFLKAEKTIPTNVYSVIGKEGFVVEDIDNINLKGSVKINGELWSATSNSNIPKGTKVIVEKVNGVKVEVKPIF